MTAEELAFLKANLGDMSPAFLRQLKRDVIAEKKRRRGADASAKAQGSGKQTTGQSSERQPGSAGGEATLSQKAPGATAGKRKANELDSSNSGGSMEPAARRPAPGPQSGAGSAPLSARAKGTFASTGEQAVNNGRQLSYAEVSVVYAGVVTGRPEKGGNAGVDSSATLPTKNGAFGEGTEGRDVK
jgi:hypothetical protein